MMQPLRVRELKCKIHEGVISHSSKQEPPATPIGSGFKDNFHQSEKKILVIQIVVSTFKTNTNINQNTNK